MAHAIVMQVNLVGDRDEGMKQSLPGGPTVITCSVFEVARDV